MTQVLPREKKHVRGSTTCTWDWRSVHTRWVMSTWVKKMLSASVKSWRCSGTSVHKSARSSIQQVKMSRQQPVATDASAASWPGDQQSVYSRPREVVRRLSWMSKREKFYIASDYDTELKSISESSRIATPESCCTMASPYSKSLVSTQRRKLQREIRQGFLFL